jgi:Holliday junction resolvasome RuvABC endonuclease subunit
MTGPAILGLDLSISATGVADPSGRLLTIKPRGRTGPQRLAYLRDRILEQTAFGVDLVAIEGYSFHSKGSGIYQLAELGGVIRLALHEAGIAYVEISPSSLKKYATGNGNAAKDQVLVACCRRLNLDPPDNNAADAAWLRVMTLDHYGQPPVDIPQAHRAALAGVAWPDLEAVAS